MIHFFVPQRDLSIAQDYLERGDIGSRATLIPYEDVPELDELPRGVYVFTGLNRLGAASAQLMASVHALLERSQGVRPLNHPLTSLRRYELLVKLFQEGRNSFQAFGAWEDLSDVRFPAFVRFREQDGGVPELLTHAGQVDRVIGRELMDGWSLEELLVVEFADTSDEQGLFRKYSAYRIGDRVFPATLDVGHHWIAKRFSAVFTREIVEEERAYAFENPHEEQLREIFDLAGIEFGRIDYALLEGRIQTWEINTLPLLRRPPGVEPVPDELKELREPRREFFERAYQEAWHELLASAPQGEPVALEHPDELLEPARRELRSRGATTSPESVRFASIRRLLRPAKRLLKPVAAWTLHPWLTSRARRARRAGGGGS